MASIPEYGNLANVYNY